MEINHGLFEFHLVTRKPMSKNNNHVFPDFFDITDATFKEMDVAINFAAIVHQPKLKDEAPHRKINYELPLFLANKAKENGCDHFIQISTINVYGGQQQIDVNTACKPDNHYGHYKLKADVELAKIAVENFVITSLRPSMVYGDANAPGNIQLLIKLVKTGIPLPFGGLRNQRNFLDIHNLSLALAAIIKKQLGGPVILADEEAVSTSELVAYISNALGKKNLSFRLPLFWKLVALVKPSLAQKLAGNLQITNTHSFTSLGIKPITTVKRGVANTIQNQNDQNVFNKLPRIE